VGATGVILGAVYMLWLVERVFYGQMKNPENRGLADLSLREGLVMAPMIALIVVMGLVPQPFLDPAKPAVDRLIGRLAAADAKLRRDQIPDLPQRLGTEPPAITTVRAGGPGPAPSILDERPPLPFGFPRRGGAN